MKNDIDSCFVDAPIKQKMSFKTFQLNHPFFAC